MATNYFIKLDHFEGPLDLLLHLIKAHELDIFDINLLALTTQYLEYLRLIQFKDIRDASYFLDMASSLVEIKSKHLISKEDEELAEDSNLDNGELSVAQLQTRLAELDLFQKAGFFLGNLNRQDKLTLPGLESERLAELYEEREGEIIGDASVLLILYEQMLATLAERRPSSVIAARESISVIEIMQKMRNHLEKLRFFMLQGIFAQMSSRYELVAYILAVLHLACDHEIKLFQDETCGPIWLAGKDEEAFDFDKVKANGTQMQDLHWRSNRVEEDSRIEQNEQ